MTADTRRLGAYVMLSEVASGGQGAVWRARHDSGQVVALKVLALPDHESLKRFQQEARVLARLAHPNLLRVLDHGEVGGIPFLASELIDGQDLLTLIQSSGLPNFAQSAQILITIAHVLQHCHEQGIVHRDVKPANVLIERGTQRPVLVDFGLVKRDPKQMHLASLEHTQFSLSGSVKGTPEFMAPEQVNPQTFGEVSPRTDVYGLGATLYYLLTGRPPFGSGQLVVVLRKVTRKAPEDPARINPRVPRPLADLCLRCLSKQPAQRPASAQAFARDLQVAAGISSVQISPPQPPTRADPTPAGRSSSSRLQALGPRAGARLGPFTIVEELGRGGMGVVLKARHDDGREAAVKILSNVAVGEKATKRFQREAKALAELDHPNVVGYLDSGTEPQPWLAMAFVPGGDLSLHLQLTGVPEFEETAKIMAQVAEGIAHAHESGIVHRDLKPANVLLSKEGHALVTDFGLARSLDASRYTKSGDHIGTLAYMSPEQVQGRRDASFPVDVWALGVLLYRCLAGELPFTADSSVGLAGQIVAEKIRRPRYWNLDVPPDLEATCMACLQRPIDRRPTAAEVASALRERRPLGPLPGLGGMPKALVGSLAALAAILLAVGGALALGGSDPDAPRKGGLSVAPPPEITPPETPDPPATPTTAAPWPAPAEGWSRAWFLGAEPAPRLGPPSMWSQPGRVAAPLDAARRAKPGDAVPGYLGEARALEGGRVRARYADLERALRPEHTGPGDYFILGRPGTGGVVSRSLGEGDLLCPNDTGGIVALLGSARWRRPALTLRARLVGHEDMDQLRLSLGVGTRGVPPFSLLLVGRSGVAQVSGGKTPLGHRLSDRWERIRLTPGAARGERIRLGNLDASGFDQAWSDAAPEGAVEFSITEAYAGFDSVVVEGEPLRPDLPALARIPCPQTSGLRIAAAFEREEDGWGGPCLSLGDDGHWDKQLRLELDRDVLRLHRGRALLAERPIASEAGQGWLALERTADRVRATLVLGEERIELERIEPLPLPGNRPHAAYGSSGPTVRFSAVEVHAGPDDPGRRELDALATNPSRALDHLQAADDPLSRWRRGALLLSRISDPRLADPRLVGQAARGARHAAAARAAQELTSAAPQLSDAQRIDALARAALARIVAAEPEAAERAARLLVDTAGLHAAREQFDGLILISGGSLLPRVIKGYVNIRDVEVREAALRAAAVLSPQDVGEILVERSMNVRNQQPRPDARTPQGRATLEGALSLLDQAKRAGFTDTRRISRLAAEYLMDLERLPEALAAWDHGLLGQTFYWGWLRRAHALAQLGRLPEAIESAIGALAGSRGQARVHELMANMLEQTPADAAPGRVAVALLVLGTERKDANMLEQSRQLAARAIVGGQGPREQDLAAYVLARHDGLDDHMGRGRPTSVLVRARLGDPEAQRRLKTAAKEDQLVGFLARLDPGLAPFLR